MILVEFQNFFQKFQELVHVLRVICRLCKDFREQNARNLKKNKLLR